MTDHRFDADVLKLLEAEREVDIETTLPDDRAQRTTIWVVISDGDVFVRSWRGARARWYQAAVDRPAEVALWVAGRRLLVVAILATDGESVARCSAALAEKYAGDPSTPSMVRPEILGTTMRLEPASE
ncbi:DUF2255 family protein [soil metagenome]